MHKATVLQTRRVREPILESCMPAVFAKPFL
jgi:hypothetical protein